MKRKVLLIILIIIFSGVTIYGLFNMLFLQKDYNEAYLVYKNSIESNISELKKINSDIIGWIKIDNTNINYPIVKGKDNDYYLNHLYDKTKNSLGSIFMDYRNNDDFSDKNTIIYGHFAKNNMMFADLAKFKDQSFYDSVSDYQIIIENDIYKVKIFSTYVSDVYTDAWKLDFNDKEFAEWLKNTQKKSMIKSNIIPKDTDLIVTLSTCSYEFKNARFVVVGILQKL